MSKREKKNVIFILKLTSFLYMLPYNMKFIFYYQLLCCFLCCCCCCVFFLSFLLLMHSISICTMLISSSYWIFYSAFFSQIENLFFWNLVKIYLALGYPMNGMVSYSVWVGICEKNCSILDLMLKIWKKINFGIAISEIVHVLMSRIIIS